MTKKLEELLDLPEVKETMEQVETPKAPEEVKKETVNLERSIAEFDKISAALPMVKGLGELADKELDDLAEKAKQSYEDLMDLGMNVESRYAGRVFETASNMLRNAIDAKSQKLDKKLKMVELQLKKEKQDKDSTQDGNVINGDGYVVTDRNSLLERLKGLDKDK